MREIELKILNVNEKDVENKLLSLGAKKRADVIVKEKIFDFDDRRITKNKDLFRLREIGEKVELTYKDSKKENSEFLDHEETETEIKDFKSILKIIEKIGLKIIREREKRRISFILDNIKIEIDKYPEIPAYIEIESSDKEKIIKLVEKLGYSVEDTVAKTATEILEKYKVNPNIQKFK